MSRARRTFLADQWAAATQQTQRTLIGNAGLVNVPVGELARIGATAPARAIWQLLVDGLRTGVVTPCDHLDPAAPGAVYWTEVGANDHLQCRLCWVAFVATLNLSALPDTGPCAACGETVESLHPFNLVAGPVTIAAVLCPACADEAGSA